jgi:hypothetical protein
MTVSPNPACKESAFIIFSKRASSFQIRLRLDKYLAPVYSKKSTAY